MMKSEQRSLGVLLATGCCAVLWMLVGPVSADIVLLDDTFDVPAGAATRGDDATDSLDTAWYTIGPGATPSELSLVADSTINSGNAFEVAGGVIDSRVWGGFASTKLANVGDYLELSFDINVTSNAASTTGFRFGLYDSTTEPTGAPTADKTDDTTYMGATNGYVMMLSTDSSSPFCMTRRETLDGEVLSAAHDDQYNYDAPKNSAGYLTTNTKHSIAMTLTKTDTGAMGAGMRTVLTVDGVEVLNYVDDGTYTQSAAADPYGYLDRFDGIVLGDRPTGTAGAEIFRVDNVRVATNVPEPGAIALLAIGVLMLAVRRGGH